jgi:4-hydroxy-tetrahydrodipicolinate reductase
MKIALIGYGKMGKAIEQIAIERGHEIVLKITSKNKDQIQLGNFNKAEVAIEFSRPEFAVENINACLKHQIPVAIGTTGWYSEFESISLNCEKQNACFLAASNFSVGVNLFFQLNKQLARLMSKQTDYVSEVEEIHHTEKLDSPSGTAITLAEGIIESHNGYSTFVNKETTKKEQLPIISLREPNVPGTHEIKYNSEIDEISIKHTAKSRKGFALGAVLAVEFIHNKKGIYSMSDVLNQ